MTNKSVSPEFTQKTKDKLKDRVAGLCSNPNHRVSTQAPKGDELVNNLGEAAHITAAKEGGARYNENLTNSQRKHINNGIWLCSICHTKIDNDEDKYTKTLLLTWRAAAEGYAMSIQGKKPIENRDLQEQMSTMLHGASSSFQQNSITNVHKGLEIALEKLDPRFNVESYRDEKGARFNIIPNQDVELGFLINSENEPDFPQKLDSFTKHGEDITIATNSVSVKGSKLHQQILENCLGGNFTLKGRTMDVVLKLKLVDEDSGEVFYFDDVFGKGRFGTESFSFEGSTCQGMFQYKSKQSADHSGEVNAVICFEAWEGIDLRYLGHFQKLHSFFTKLYKGWRFIQNFEIDGINYQETTSNELPKHEMIKHLYFKLEYIRFVTEIAIATNQAILFNPTFTIIKTDFDNLQNLAKEIKGKKYNSKEIGSWKCGFTVMKSSLEEYSKKSDYTLISTIEPIKCFDQEFLLPEYRRNVINFDFVVIEDNCLIDGVECARCKLVPNNKSYIEVSCYIDDKLIR